MGTITKRGICFHIIGVAFVGFWLVMIGLLVKRVHFQGVVSDPAFERAVFTIDSPQREWKEIYLNKHKVGYATDTIKPFEGGYFIQEEIFLKLNLMGLDSGVYTLTQSRVDDQFLLKSFSFNMTSGVVTFRLSGKLEDGYLLVETGRGRDRRKQKIKVSTQPMIGSGLAHYFKSRKIHVGETHRLPIFDPSTMAHREVIITVAAKEPLEVYGIKYNAFRLEGQMWGQSVTFWLDENGSTLKEEGFMGLTTIRSSAARAPRDLEGTGAEDLYEMTAIKVNKTLPKPSRLSYLRLEANGMDSARIKPEVWEGKRQRFQDGILEIKREKVPSKGAYVLPYEANGDEMKRFLDPDFNIESDDREIIEQARRISGTDKNPVSVSKKLMHWVYKNLEKRPVVQRCKQEADKGRLDAPDSHAGQVV